MKVFLQMYNPQNMSIWKSYMLECTGITLSYELCCFELELLFNFCTITLTLSKLTNVKILNYDHVKYYVTLTWKG